MANKKLSHWQREAEALKIPYHFRKKEDVVKAIEEAKKNVIKSAGNKSKQTQKDSKKERIKIMILSDDLHKQDITHYEKFLSYISKKTDLYILGIHIDENEKFLPTVKYNYLKPVSIISLFKQIQEINADLTFVPLIFNEYNKTSSDYIIYMVSALFDMPILAPDFYPFNEAISNNENGFLYSDKTIKDVFDKNISLEAVKNAGYVAKKNVIKGFSLNKDNVECFLSKFA